MDYGMLGASAVVVGGVLAGTGAFVSALSTQLQCSKIGIGTSMIQGLYFAFLPTVVYTVAAFFNVVRGPFSRTFHSYGVGEDFSPVLGVWYLVMMATWISATQVISASERAVCNPSTAEMSEFKKKMLAELQEKEKAKQPVPSK